jgi:hypothetical protein
MGINIPNIRSVIHVEVPDMLRDYRRLAGADEVGNLVIIIAPRTYQAPKWDLWEEGMAEGKEAISSSGSANGRC